MKAMDERKWTPEPWFITGMTLVDKTGREFNDISIVSADDTWLARMTQRSDEGLDEENGARIVECVNACAGIPDPAAFIARVRELEAALGPFAEFIKHYDPFGTEDAADAVCTCGGAWLKPSAVTVADFRRAANALANVKEGG